MLYKCWRTDAFFITGFCNILHYPFGGVEISWGAKWAQRLFIWSLLWGGRQPPPLALGRASGQREGGKLHNEKKARLWRCPGWRSLAWGGWTWATKKVGHPVWLVWGASLAFSGWHWGSWVGSWLVWFSQLVVVKVVSQSSIVLDRLAIVYLYVQSLSRK